MVMETPAHSDGLLSSGIANKMVVFMLEDLRYALRLAAVERVIRIMEVVALPKAPEIVLGVVNVQGEIIPVMNVRKRFRLPERELDLSDHLIIARTARRKVALAVDAVTGVIEGSAESMTSSDRILRGLDYV